MTCDCRRLPADSWRLAGMNLLRFVFPIFGDFQKKPFVNLTSLLNYSNRRLDDFKRLFVLLNYSNRKKPL